MSYYVDERKTKTSKLYHVIEKDTGHIVTSSDAEKTARTQCRSLNLGAGFNGWTPEFFTYVYQDSK